MKKELLSPAGDWASLKAAIHNGADAVYLAGKNYGARKFAKNFLNEELEEAVKYAHLYGVKIYVTVNTIIYEDEIKDVLEYIEFLNNIGVDALIVQDMGLITLIRKYFPKMTIHASTQAHTHNLEQIKFLESLGVKRVVLAREMSLEQINALPVEMELEVFVYGALCVCYSGQCLFSALTLGRSGNRGECAGLCRVLYDLKADSKTILKSQYLLSPKELNTTNYGEELKNSKVLSFKIEGRMKSPEYVGYVTRIERKILDEPNYKLTPEEIFNLKSLFNRGFTKGYLFQNTDEEFRSLNSSNHQGVKVGQVIAWDEQKIKIKVSHDFRQGDAIRLPNKEGMYVNFLYAQNGKLINEAKAGDIVTIQNKVNLKELGDVLLTVNKKLEEEIKNTKEKKIKVDVDIYAHKNAQLIIKYKAGENEVKYRGEIVNEAKTSPLEKTRIKEILGKLGNTPFILNEFKGDIEDNIFIPVGKLNEIRRELIKALEEKRKNINRNKEKLNFSEPKVINRKSSLKISALARTEEQVKALINKVDYIYVTEEKLEQKYRYLGNVYLRLARVIEEHKEYNNKKLLIGETGSLKYGNNNEVISDYYLNVVNSYYARLLKQMGVKRVTLSPELTLSQMAKLLEHLEEEVEIEIIGYGKLELMVMKYDFFRALNLTENKKYSIENKQGSFRVIKDNYTHVMANKEINLINKIAEIKKMGVNVFRLELFDENALEIEELLEQIKRAI